MKRCASLPVMGLASAALLFAACAKEIQTTPPPTGQVTPVFDPSASPPAVPTPTDLARDAATGLLKVPVADATQNPAQAYLDSYLNTLNGFPSSATAEVKFTGELDEKSVSAESIKVYELGEGGLATDVADLVFEHKKVEAAGKTTSLVRVWNYAGWKRGASYAFFVLTGSDKGVKDAAGKALTRSALFEVATAASPLCEWDPNTSFDAASGRCATPATGKPALGCCTYNYSALIDSSVKKAIHDDPKYADKPAEEVEALIKSSILAKATDFERLRRGFGGLLAVAEKKGLKREQVAVLWSFTVVNMNEAIFEPASVPPRVPSPTDLVRDPATGFLAVPSAPTASDAEKEFNAYLNSLDGFPAASSPTLDFYAELDEATITGSVLGFQVAQDGISPLSDVSTSWNAGRKRLTLSRKGGFPRGGKVVLVALGGAKGLKNKESKDATAPKRSALMHLALSPHPLCTFDAAKKECTDTKVSSFIDDPASKPGAMTGLQKATRFELIRQAYDAILKGLDGAGVLKREEVASLWAFSVTSQTEVVYDPTAGVIPFPNNLLIDQGTGKVNIPARPGESAAQAALRQGLNTLDGFSTQGGSFAVVTGKIDPPSLEYGVGGLALDLDAKATIAMNFTFEERAPAIVATPASPLGEKTQHAVVLLSRYKAGDLKPTSGLKDDKGRRLIPSVFTVLIRNRHSLLAAGGKSAVSVLDDATALQAEMARMAHKPLFDSLEAQGFKREDVVAAWTFKTQTIAEPMTKLRAMPWQILAAADFNTPKLGGTIDATLAGWPAAAPKDALGGFVPDGTFVSWNALDAKTGAFLPDPTKGKAELIPFLLALPKGTMPAGGWPVALFQHGLNGQKTAMFELANSLAKVGYATLAFDAGFHGSRSLCTKNEHCTAGGTCDLAAGKCSTALLDTDGDGTPDASGARFLVLANPFAVRDNLRQHVVDAAVLLRAIALNGASGIAGLKFDPTKVQVIGQSLGGILSTLVAAVDPLPQRAVLNVPGAPLPIAYANSPAFKKEVTEFMTAQGAAEGSVAYLQLINTFCWIVDPGDPGNFARYLQKAQLPDLVKAGTNVPKKSVIVQLAGKDQTLPTIYGKYLAEAAGIDISKTVFADQGHGFLRNADPAGSEAATAAAQLQAATFLSTGTVCTPNVTAGTCN